MNKNINKNMNNNINEDMNKNRNDVTEIWIIRLDRLGDLLLTIPSIVLLKEQYSSAKLTIIVHEEFVEFLKKIFPSDTILGVQRAWGLKKIRDILRVIIVSRKKRYDCALDLFTGTNHLSSLLLWIVSAKIKTGYGVGLRKYFLKNMVYPGKIKYEADMVYDILQTLGITKKITRRLPPNKKSELRQRISKPYIIIHPWASEKEKEWPFFDSLISWLCEYKKYTCVLIGSPAEKTRSKELMEKIKNNCIIDMTGLLDITALCSCISEAEMFIGNNSGPMHIASLSGVQTYVLSGYSSTTRWILPEKHVYVFQCSQEDLEQKKQKKSLMEKITVNEVKRILKKRL